MRNPAKEVRKLDHTLFKIYGNNLKLNFFIFCLSMQLMDAIQRQLSFNRGKLKKLKTIQTHSELHGSLLVFNNESTTPEEILRARGYLLKLFKAPINIKSLNHHRYDVFRKTVASTTKQV